MIDITSTLTFTMNEIFSNPICDESLFWVDVASRNVRINPDLLSRDALSCSDKDVTPSVREFHSRNR